MILRASKIRLVIFFHALYKYAKWFDSVNKICVFYNVERMNSLSIYQSRSKWYSPGRTMVMVPDGHTATYVFFISIIRLGLFKKSIGFIRAVDLFLYSWNRNHDSKKHQIKGNIPFRGAARTKTHKPWDLHYGRYTSLFKTWILS